MVANKSDHHALRNVGQGHVVLEESGEEEWSARGRGNTEEEPQRHMLFMTG